MTLDHRMVLVQSNYLAIMSNLKSNNWLFIEDNMVVTMPFLCPQCENGGDVALWRCFQNLLLHC